VNPKTDEQDMIARSRAVRLEPQLVVVTGGNGWLGRRVVEALTRGLEDTRSVSDGGNRVRCLVPPGEDANFLLDLAVEIVRGDLRDQKALERLVDGAKGALLLHIAGVIHPKRISDFEEINTRGTVQLVDVARRSGVRRIVVMSSNSPIGCNPYPEHRFTEESPYNPYMGYGRSKWLMELALLEAIASGKAPETVILRAPWFYGPGQPPRQTLFFTLIKEGRFPLLGTGSNRRSLGYVDNLAQGVILALAHPAAAGEIYWLADETPYSMREIVDAVRSVLRNDFGFAVKEKTLRVPSLVGDLATFADGLLQAAGVYQQKIHVLSEMNKNIACDIGKAQRQLGYTPRISLREGMRRSVAWCLDQGQII
jgi:nucleoside-diphosphate-sugar epimerase